MSRDYNKLIKKYNFDYFIIPNNLGLNTYLNSNDNYVRIYHDKNSNIYKYKKTAYPFFLIISISTRLRCLFY